MVSHIEKIKALFFNPGSFFKSVAKEDKYMPIALYFVAAYIISYAIQTTFSFPAMIKGLELRGITKELSGSAYIFVLVMGSVLGLLFSAVIGFVAPFVGSAVNHIGVLIVGGKKGFFNTFKPSTYAMVISIGYGILSSFVFFALNIINPSFVSPSAMGISAFSLAGMPLPSIAIALFIGLVAMIHTLYTEVIGISRFQNISKGRAFFAVLILPLILIILAVLVGLSLALLVKSQFG